ncbi:MAG: HAMP domain-containing histidine kinase [Bdellovibrionales bacterium]|nr:HAMP domain-containing histidine kinase [Bdellovibrionales bacterium]
MNNNDPAIILTDVVVKLSMVTSIESLTRAVAEAARKLCGADGACFILRDGDMCYYVDENAVSPLWKGRRFPIEICVSGWSMYHKEVVVIKDIYQDQRVSHDAYRPTFIKSLCMTPIRADNPVGAIGVYWADEYIPDGDQLRFLQILANSTAVAIENVELKETIKHRALEQANFQDGYYLENAINTIVHDLRNPLTTMMAFTDLVQLKLRGRVDEQINGYLDCITKAGLRAKAQIQQMLSLHTVTNRAVVKEVVDITELAKEIFHDLLHQAPQRSVHFKVEPHLHIFADKELFRLALENLIANAFKYTGKNASAEIEIGRRASSGHVDSLYVKDNGVGFDQEQACLLFRPLVRLHKDSEFEGNGLGLASVARIINMHGGSVRAEGEKSKGATFIIDLPADIHATKQPSPSGVDRQWD